MRLLIVLGAVATCALVLGVGVGSGASTTKVTLASFYVDENGVVYPATCQETQVINDNQRKETFQCTFDAAAPAPFVCDTSIGCVWFSDFDGAEATSAHWVITPSGQMFGWALY